MKTTLFKSGNSLAVRIPQALWLGKPGTKVEITKDGENLIIHAIQPSLEGVLDVFAGFDSDFMADGRDAPAETDRNW